MALSDNELLASGDRSSLGTDAARTLSTTSKSPPFTQEITQRWLLKMLPWVSVKGGVFRVNRRLSYEAGDGRVSFTTAGQIAKVIPQQLCEISVLQGFDDAGVLAALANGFTQQDFAPGDVIVARGQKADRVVLIVDGKIAKLGVGPYGEETDLGRWADGDHFGEESWSENPPDRSYSAKALTRCRVLLLTSDAFKNILSQSSRLQQHLEHFKARAAKPRNKQGEAAIALSSAHQGEARIPGTFVDYDPNPREYPLSLTQTVLRVHTRISDLYNQPFNQTEEQIRLTIQAVRERQEFEMINHPDFGLLNQVHGKQRIYAKNGPPTPHALDDLLTRRRKTRLILAHPKAIAAFACECNRQGLYPGPLEIEGRPVMAWRGVPILPCDKIPISRQMTTSILALRTGLEDQGVVGLRPENLSDEVEPGLSVRFKSIDERAIATYLVSAYYSTAVMVPDALGVLEQVEIAR